MRILRTILLLSLGGVCGCAGAGAGTTLSARRPTTAATQPLDPKALLPLEQLKPVVALPQPATEPSADAPLEALQLFAQARAAATANDRIAATALLEKASKLDPDSFEIWFGLGKAYLGNGNGNASAIQAMLRAEVIRPDHLETQVHLGRMYLNESDWEKAILHLRRARITGDYADTPALAALADLLLARALQQQGYEQAAIDCYDSLLSHLQYARINAYQTPELYDILRRSAALYVQVGQMFERIGRLDDALRRFQQAEARDGGDLDIQQCILRVLVGLGREDQAKQRAAEIVIRTHASPGSLELFRDLYRRMDRESAVADELKRLLRNTNGSKPILFALVETLRGAGRDDEARTLLEEFWNSTNADPEVLRRLFDLYADHKQADQAARLLIESVARRADSLRQTEPMWDRLLRSGGLRLRLSSLQKLEVSPQAQAAKFYWVARLAEMWNRDSLVRSALEQSAAQRPPFAPAYRMLIGRYWARSDWDDAHKTTASQKLIDRVQQSGDAALAAELSGLLALSQNQLDPAIAAFEESVKLGNTSADVQAILARALLARNSVARGEQILWKLVSDYPAYDDGYELLFGHYVQRRSPQQAIKVLQTWLMADPTNINARVLQARVLTDDQTGGNRAAEQILGGLFREQPENPAVLAALVGHYSRAAQRPMVIAKLEEERQRHPDNRAVVEALVGLYTTEKRPADATKALDDMRRAVAADADLLYYVAHQYERVDQKQITEQVLEQVLKLEPRHAGAGNDLGYMWADEGKNLDRAEALIRLALEEEPDNGAFLDSLGWVLYKRGEFADARKYLEQAVKGSIRPDAVVLDHLGDVLYRLAQRDQAAECWQKSLQRLGEDPSDRDDLKQLRGQLQQKLKQQKAGQPVNVAPVAVTEPKPAQAKN